MTPEAFEELYRATARDLFGYVRRRSPLDAEDLVAEVYAVAWRRRTDLPAPALRRAWLFGTARTLLLAEGRRLARDRELTELASSLAPFEAGGPASDRAAVVAAALARLAPQEREIVLLVEWEGLTPTEVAVVLGVRPGTARVRLHRARRTLAVDPELERLLDAGPTVLSEGVAVQ